MPLADAERALSEARGQAAWLSAADARLGAIVRGPRVEERDAALARTAAAEARLAGAQTALARRSVVSPCDGTVLWSRWHAGELFGPSAGPLVVLGDMRLQIRLEVDELDAAAVSIGASCEVFTDIGEGVASCKVDRVAPAFGRRSLLLEAPSSRTDVRIREVFVEVRGGRQMAPGQRLWVHVPRAAGSPQ